jgi:hypothetical protein
MLLDLLRATEKRLGRRLTHTELQAFCLLVTGWYVAAQAGPTAH